MPLAGNYMVTIKKIIANKDESHVSNVGSIDTGIVIRGME
ncbi:hypothetical protein BAXH7_00516 [Bacillus amyloliquefaciens XH7]|nr:hypothetical protein BAXH7_00516 [Bacillus amyloliquefaciens XH7]